MKVIENLRKGVNNSAIILYTGIGLLMGGAQIGDMPGKPTELRQLEGLKESKSKLLELANSYERSGVNNSNIRKEIDFSLKELDKNIRALNNADSINDYNLVHAKNVFKGLATSVLGLGVMTGAIFYQNKRRQRKGAN